MNSVHRLKGRCTARAYYCKRREDAPGTACSNQTFEVISDKDMTAEEHAVSAAARELEVSQRTVASWLNRGTVLRWIGPGAIDPADIARARRVLHFIYDNTRGSRRDSLILQAFVGRLNQPKFADDEVFLSHWEPLAL